MSEPYQAYLFMPSGIPPGTAVHSVDGLLAQLDGTIDEDSLLILNDFETHEPEPEYVRSAPEALRDLSNWPTMGSIDYMYCDGMITIAFKKQRNRVVALEISILMGAFDRSEAYQTCYLTLIKELDELLTPIRTIMQWGLEYSGFRWVDELQRLRSGRFDNTYDLLDIRRKPPSEQ